MEKELVAWLRRRIRARLALARGTVELGNNAVWTEPSSGVLVTGDGTDTDAWDGTWALGDSTLTRLMEANDPRDTVARCEAELAILDLHAGNGYERYPECVHCAAESWPCRTVRLVGSAYKHQPGYQAEAWGLPVRASE